MVYNFFDQRTSGITIKNKIIYDKELGEELHKQVIRNLKKRKVQLAFIDNILLILLTCS